MEYGEHLQNIRSYYTGTVMDYRFWSENYSFHFGYYKAGVNPLSRTKLLEQLEKEIFLRLDLEKINHGHVLDLGCGLGGSMRTGSKEHKAIKFSGINFMADHVDIGNEITTNRGLSGNVRLIESDYLNLPFREGTADGAYMLESFCYCPKEKTTGLATELLRVLRPGARVVIADGFQNRAEKSMSSYLHKTYLLFCECWALSGLQPHASVIEAFEKAGFILVKNEDVSMRVLPSFIHIPFALSVYLLKHLISGKFKNIRNKETLRHLKGSSISMLIGLNRKQFRYGMITFQKPMEK